MFLISVANFASYYNIAVPRTHIEGYTINNVDVFHCDFDRGQSSESKL